MELLITNDDGSTTKFTEDMAVTAIKERDQLRTEVIQHKEYNDKSSTRLFNVREQVFNFFNNEYEAGNTELTFQVDDINTLLKDIGCDLLKSLFTVRGSINFEITDVEAESEDDARNTVENYLEVKWEEDGDLTDWSVEIDRVTEQ